MYAYYVHISPSVTVHMYIHLFIKYHSCCSLKNMTMKIIHVFDSNKRERNCLVSCPQKLFQIDKRISITFFNLTGFEIFFKLKLCNERSIL